MLGACLVQRGVGKVLGAQDSANQNQGRATKALGLHQGLDIRQGAADPILIRPTGAMDHSNRAVGAIVRQQFGDDLCQVHHAQVNGHGRAMAGEVGQLLAGGHFRLARIAGEDHGLRDGGQGQFAFQQRRTGRRGGDAGDDLKGDRQCPQVADLFTDGAVQ